MYKMNYKWTTDSIWTRIRKCRIQIHIHEYIQHTRTHGLSSIERNRHRDNITRARYLCSVLIEPDPNHLEYDQSQPEIGSQTAHWFIPISATGQTITGQPQSQ